MGGDTFWKPETWDTEGQRAGGSFSLGLPLLTTSAVLPVLRPLVWPLLGFFTSLVTDPKISVSPKPLGGEKKVSGADEHPSTKTWN